LDGRVYTGVEQGDAVQPYYDPMLAKLVAHATDRDSAFRKLNSMLDKSIILGLTTNRAFLSSLCNHPAVLQGDVHTNLIETDHSVAKNAEVTEGLSVGLKQCAALAAVVSVNFDNSLTGAPENPSVFARLGLWQAWGPTARNVSLMFSGELISMQVTKLAERDWQIDHVNQKQSLHWSIVLTDIDLQSIDRGTSIGIEDASAGDTTTGMTTKRGLFVAAIGCEEHVFCRVGSTEAHFARPSPATSLDAGSADKQLLAPMPGRIVSVSCQAGDTVAQGDAIITLEAMKMEHALCASAQGQIEKVFVKVGDQVEQGMLLAAYSP